MFFPESPISGLATPCLRHREANPEIGNPGGEDGCVVRMAHNFKQPTRRHDECGGRSEISHWSYTVFFGKEVPLCPPRYLFDFGWRF